MRPTIWVAGAVLVAALSIPAYGQSTKPHPDMHKPGVEDPYAGIRNFDGVSCCNGKDCRQVVNPIVLEELPGGRWLVEPTGESVEPGPRAFSPSGAYHIGRAGRWTGTLGD